MTSCTSLPLNSDHTLRGSIQKIHSLCLLQNHQVTDLQKKQYKSQSCIVLWRPSTSSTSYWRWVIRADCSCMRQDLCNSQAFLEIATYRESVESSAILMQTCFLLLRSSLIWGKDASHVMMKSESHSLFTLSLNRIPVASVGKSSMALRALRCLLICLLLERL